MLNPKADFDGSYTFYYDETNNIRKFYVGKDGFNTKFTGNFVLGGLVHLGPPPNIQPLLDSLKLQKTINEIKFKHIATGDFLDCLKSEKLEKYLKFIEDSDIYVHYSSLNILYWSIVDIVDSAIASSGETQRLGLEFLNTLKNDLYKLCKCEIDAVTKLFYKYGYPNIKSNDVSYFIEEFTSLFNDHIKTQEFHLSLESLRQLLKEAKKNNSLPFIMEADDYILLSDLSHFYLRPIFMFKNSCHIFDKESSIEELLNNYNIVDIDKRIKNYNFVDSTISQFNQLSDVFVGIMGKLTTYLNTSTQEKIKLEINLLSPIQCRNIDLLMKAIEKSFEKNLGFIHNIDSYEEMSKMGMIKEIRKKNCTK